MHLTVVYIAHQNKLIFFTWQLLSDNRKPVIFQNIDTILYLEAVDQNHATSILEVFLQNRSEP